MHLSKLQHQDFWHRGWMVVESVFAVEEADSIAQLATRLCERELYASDSTSAADRSNDGLHVAPRKLGSPFTKSPEFAKFVLDKQLINPDQTNVEVETGAGVLKIRGAQT